MRSNTYVKLALTLACALGAGSPGFGQATPPPTGSAPAVPRNTSNATPSDDEDAVLLAEFNIVGSFAGSLAMSAEMKQSSPSITEVIAAEDIGKLPDVSIADSLTRLTGLTTQRQNGRSQAIIIRGLTGDYSSGLLNGREQATPNMNRTVEYDQYPADVLNEVVVYKTAEANLTSQGIAGTIDMRTVKPLSKRGRVMSASVYYDWIEYGKLTPGADDTGYRLNFSYVDQSDDGKLGIGLAVSLTSKPFAGKQFQAWGDNYPTEDRGAFVLGGTKSYVRNNTLDRNGVMLVLEHRPNDLFHQTFDFYASEFEERQYLRGMEIPFYWSSAQLQPGYTVEDGLVTDSTFTNVQPVVRNDVFQREARPISVGYNLVIGEKNAWPITFDIGYSQVDRDDQNLETYSGLGFRGAVTAPAVADTMRVQLRPGKTPIITSTLDYADGSILRLTDPQGWGPDTLPGGGMQGYLKKFSSTDDVLQASLGTSHRMDGFFRNIAFGAAYNDRGKEDGQTPTGWMNSSSTASTSPLPPGIGTTDMGFLGLGRIYAYDPFQGLKNDVWGFTQNTDSTILAEFFDVSEKITQFYVQADMKGKLGEMDFFGNVGVRYIMNRQSSNGVIVNGTLVQPASISESYDQWAPNLGLNLQLTDKTVARLSLARQIARPRMFDMRAAGTWSYHPQNENSTDVTNSPWSASGGNPLLKPWESDSLDLSVEHYFKNNRGYVAVAGFYKDLKSYIYNQGIPTDFTGYPPPAGQNPAIYQGFATVPMNGEGGSIKGLEFTLSLPSEVISESIKGFGAVFGMALTDSDVKPWGPTGPDAPISGLSEDVWNVTLYYENHGFSARVSQRYRSENRSWLTNFGVPNPGGDVGGNSGYTVAAPETITDAQISYTFGEKLKYLTIFLQAYNLTDEPLVTYGSGDSRQVTNYQTYGASYSCGASMKF